ncbi:hypothetical protein FAIPA1_70011 [Frankia sp. AiPs1]
MRVVTRPASMARTSAAQHRHRAMTPSADNPARTPLVVSPGGADGRIPHQDVGSVTFGSRGPSRPSVTMAVTAAMAPAMTSLKTPTGARFVVGRGRVGAAVGVAVGVAVGILGVTGRSLAGGTPGDDRWSAADGPSAMAGEDIRDCPRLDRPSPGRDVGTGRSAVGRGCGALGPRVGSTCPDPFPCA